MSSKRFYQKSATERQQERRRRSTAIILDSKLNEIQGDDFQTNTTDTLCDTIAMVIEDPCESTNNDDYDQFDNEDYVNKPDITTNNSNEDEDNNKNIDDENDDDQNDYDDNDEFINDFINLFDINREQKLYLSCNLSVYNACMEIVRLCRTLNLNKLQMQHLLNGLHLLLPTENKLPRTVPGLLKIVGRVAIFVPHHYHDFKSYFFLL